REARARKKGLDVPFLAAAAARTGQLFGSDPGQGVVAPLAGDGVRARERAAVHDHPAAHARPEDDAEHDVSAGSGAVGRLRKGEAVGVVRETDLPLEQPLEIGLERLFVEDAGVRVPEDAGFRQNGAWRADAYGAGLADLRLRGEHGVGE